MAGGNLSCGDSTTDRVILRGALVGTEVSGGSDLHALLQSWVDATPTVQVRGIPLTIIACSTYPGEESSCEPQAQSSPTVPQVTEASSALGGIPIYAGAAGGAVFLLVVIVVIIVLVVAVKKKRKSKTYRYNY